MDCGRIQQVVVNLIVVRDRSDDMCANVFLIVEGLQLAPHSAIRVFDEFRFRVIAVAHLISGRHLTIVPLLDFDDACAIVNFVCDVCSLCTDVPNLADEGDLLEVVSGACIELGMIRPCT